MAGIIKKEDIEKVRASADLYEIVSATVTLKASGSGTYMGLCPFHNEKTPSFSVRPSLGVWHCFGCGLGGDVFDYIEQTEDVQFGDAIEILADKYRIELHYENARPSSHQGSTRSRLLQANEEAQRYFVSQIMTKEALAARKLLAGRNFSQADSARFGCGYAPRGWDNLVRHLAAKGFTQQEMIDAGLARRGPRGVYDYLRGRATWPIRDSAGRTLGFGARRLYEDDNISAKYLNTPDTELYHKNQVLYGIDLAKKSIAKKRQVVIVEGYTDVMACHLAGVDTAVATCGTAFGEEHAKIIRRLISDDALGGIQLVGPIQGSRVIFTFDGDAAGQKAALHAFSLDGSFLTQTFVAVARDNLDPCDLRIKHGDEEVRALVANATPLYDFVINAAVSMFDTQYTTGQMGAVKAVAPVIAQIRDRSLVGMYTRKTARRIGVDLDLLTREVRQARRTLQVRDEDAYAPGRRNYQEDLRHRPKPDPYADPTARHALVSGDAARQDYYRVDDSVFICEQQFMGLLIQIPRAIDPAFFDKLGDDDFDVPLFRSLYHAIQAAGGLPGEDVPQGLWMHNLSKAAGPMLQSAINELAVMPLPLPQAEGQEPAPSGGFGARGDQSGQGAPGPGRQEGQPAPNPAAAQLRAATPEEKQYATELLVRLLDAGYMRRIAASKHRMNQLPDGQEKFELLGRITQFEAARKELQDQIYNNSL
ncbi:DNA primase [Bifidobacterium actinocoloniiforme DSM 22766]|uniref:DNA primase n=1 Tax=Bifidobacterium actinocoloniiforme DSM 22766 TaxID=1437605 RepID=A0A086Z1A8_9BIFI|nr:DNA primase [Bifidobacterium actinocoloniiforme]AKV55466.1 DNA primase [Bifidobacterium actinocoloniiforme DSM 22766]KFI40308.1 DNA primase [Bifidobacterium actinocoloniiforme DSM 22766]